MSLGYWCRRWGGRRIKAAGGELEHGLNLLPAYMKPLHDFLDTRARFEVFKNSGYRHASVFEYPCATALAGDAFHGGTL